MKFDRRLTDEIYTSDTVRLGKDAFQAMQETIYHNGGVGTITGYYDAELSILSASDLLLHNLNHPYVKPTTKKFITFFEVFRAAS